MLRVMVTMKVLRLAHNASAAIGRGWKPGARQDKPADADDRECCWYLPILISVLSTVYAGGLLPSMAIHLQKVFQNNKVPATILPSYGMTECMPIASPPPDYKLDRPGCSGLAVGADIEIKDDKGMRIEESRRAARGALGTVCRVC